MVRVIHPRDKKDRIRHKPVNQAIDSRLVTLPLGQVYLVPRHRIIPAEQANAELHIYKDETLVSRTRMWV
jgi:hypothetical protein